MSALRRTLRRLLFSTCCLAPLLAQAADPEQPLTSAAAVLSLTAEQASHRLRVSVRGTVTAAEPDWNAQFFVQDSTGGIFVENLGRPAPSPGDVVAIEGVSHPGAFAPIISTPKWAKVGVAPLPEAKPARIEAGRLLLDISVLGHRVQVRVPPGPGIAPEALIAARVLVRGTAATHYIGALRHLTSVAVYAPAADDVVVLESERMNPFDQPVIPVNNVAQYEYGRHAEERVHVRGVVTLQRAADGLFIQDASGGIRLVTSHDSRYAPGDQVEAVGFLEYENHLPLLRDATIRRSGVPGPPITARPAPLAEIQRGEHHGALITVRGRVLDRFTQPEVGGNGQPIGVVSTWLVQDAQTPFTVEYVGATEDPALAAVPIGSVIEITGVCVSTIDAAGKLTSLRILLPSPGGLRILQRPSWLTPTRLLTGVAILSVVLVVVLAWLLTVSKKNAALHRVVRELESAQRELQEAHDTLEQKVAERSAQLQVEMSARKTAEVQFKAVLAERTRLARDLHDTLEQTLAGIALRLNTAAKLSRRDPDNSEANLQVARNWLHQSQVDLRRSIWDLRSRELEQFDLPSALRGSADQIVDGTNIVLEFETDGSSTVLPEIVEENVLRIAQEALANISRHAQARHVKVRLETNPPTLRLQIDDDGVGFDHSRKPTEGHFGLLGMSERAKRLGGTLEITSTPGRGTSIALTVPLPAITPLTT